MKPPSSIKVQLHLWLTNMPAPIDFKLTTTDGMESCGWIKLGTVKQELDLSGIDVDINKAKRDALEAKKNDILEKREIELNEIEDHLASLINADIKHE